MFIIHSGESLLPPNDIRAVLLGCVSKPTWLSLSSKPFTGRVRDASFSIIRTERSALTFNPVIYGRFSASPTGTAIKMIITLHPVVWLALIGWSAFASYAYFNSTSQNYETLLLLVGPWLLGCVLFPWEVRQSKELLRTILLMKSST